VSVNKLTFKLPDSLAGAVAASLEDWKKNNKVARLWQKDASLWTGTDESNWLGWLSITEEQLAHIDALKQITADMKKARFKHALLLGMGGSSLCPEVMRMTFGKVKGHPELHVLDSTDPAQIKAIEAKVDLKSTICIVSSKSGSTLEPSIYKQYFFERVKAKVGEKEVGNRFIAITDPGSKMQQVAEADKFRKMFFGVPSIGGRYSAISNFGMVPAAVMGVNVGKFLKNTEEMVKACASSAADSNPGVLLGTILGTAAN
jgi:transaldolase/glucose-6-phosphate isomerase